MIDHTVALSRLERLSALAAYDLTAPELRRRLDELSARTAATLGQPIALVSLVLDSAQMITGASGLTGWIAEVRGTPVEWSFCANAVVSGEPYIVHDAAQDALQHDNPLVTVDGIASYAGVPLRTADGHVVGAHCVLGDAPHVFTPEQIAVLEAAATEVMQILEDHRLPGH